MMRISQQGINLVKKFEGLKLKPYLCPAKKLTIGYGHAMLPGENFDSITEDIATRLLEKDLSLAEDCINKYVSVPLNQNQFDALCDFIFNVGTGNFKSSTLLKLLNAKRYIDASNQFVRWAHVKGEISKGLASRREAERQLFVGLS